LVSKLLKGSESTVRVEINLSPWWFLLGESPSDLDIP